MWVHFFTYSEQKAPWGAIKQIGAWEPDPNRGKIERRFIKTCESDVPERRMGHGARRAPFGCPKREEAAGAGWGMGAVPGRTAHPWVPPELSPGTAMSPAHVTGSVLLCSAGNNPGVYRVLMSIKKPLGLTLDMQVFALGNVM